MGLFNFLFGSTATSSTTSSTPSFNHSSGLPMIEDSGIDVAGNPYGTDMSDTFNNSSIDDTFDCGMDNTFDSFDSGCSSFDDW